MSAQVLRLKALAQEVESLLARDDLSPTKRQAMLQIQGGLESMLSRAPQKGTNSSSPEPSESRPA